MMFNIKRRMTPPPLHQAVIEGKIEEVERLKNSQWVQSSDRYGFSPLELAQLLGQRQCQRILKYDQYVPFLRFKVQFQNQVQPKILSLDELEDAFHIIYRSFLTFPSYQILEEVIHQCPYFLRFEWLISAEDQFEVAYQQQIARGQIANASTLIKWINQEKGFGLFADIDLPEKTFVAEYTGIVREVNKKSPNINDINEYCFEYPTRFFSSKYYLIDASKEGNISRFINHSQSPNLQPLWLVNRKVLHLIFITHRPIKKNTELTFDYGVDYWRHRSQS